MVQNLKFQEFFFDQISEKINKKPKIEKIICTKITQGFVDKTLFIWILNLNDITRILNSKKKMNNKKLNKIMISFCFNQK